ncbi:adenine phosphoribosyltransferase [Candidatus Woesearchaeota archaeon]|nr:adenine phosphoribosyltransferase [Candidatus Woesearchaeota archaeon]HLC50540.1 adenine phosphoribosyltransferase [Candidatus Nanoarchaeia archaeon]
MDLKSVIRTIPNWPKQGVMFRDITTLLKDAKAFNYVIDKLCERYKNDNIDLVAGIESRGFILGGAVAHRLHKGFVPIRKEGKLPAKTNKEHYELEYGRAVVEVHVDAIPKGARVLLVDDLIATAGTLMASINLIEKLGGQVIECAVIIELPDLHGREKIEAKGYKLFSMVQFEGE